MRTDTQWQPLDLYLKVGPQTTVDLTMGLGHFGQLNLGTADFDAVTLTHVSTVPNGATVADLATATAAPAKPDAAAEGTVTQGTNQAIWVFLSILVVVGLGVAVFFLSRATTDSTSSADTEPRAPARDASQT